VFLAQELFSSSKKKILVTRKNSRKKYLEVKKSFSMGDIKTSQRKEKEVSYF